MTIYRVGLPDAGSYELCHPAERSNFDTVLRLINGVPRVADWRPIEMRIIHEDEGVRFAPSDAPWLGSHALILRARAIDVLEPLLSRDGELLSLRCAEAELQIYNPRVIDALDEGASTISRLASGRILRIVNYAFREEMLQDVHFFKIPNQPVSSTFVTEEVVRRWRDAGLRGLGFKELVRPS